MQSSRNYKTVVCPLLFRGEPSFYYDGCSLAEIIKPWSVPYYFLMGIACAQPILRELRLFPQLIHFPENLARLFIAQQGGAFRRVAMRAEELILDHAEQAADGRSHLIDGTSFGFGVEQWAGVYPLLQVILHLLLDSLCGASGSLDAAHIFQPRQFDRPATIGAAFLALKRGDCA